MSATEAESFAANSYAEDAVRLQALYQEALASQAPDRHNHAREQLARILALLVQGREVTAALRADYERLWLAENRPHGLGMILAQFDRDARLWVDKSEEVRVHTVLFRNGKPLPTIEQIGFAP